MRLTAIKLAGFKSFVDPTTLRVPGKLTGVVGPNGCGKSNVIDAVRWVLGEMSAKQLRGESSADVIFNGSRTRKPVGRASVELIFDNADGKLGGQYSSFAEIAVKRELTRDGESNYLINNTRCRRRDVIDLFLGTGLGGRSNYAIIEQGMLAQLIEAKPEDVRMLLEEAAGISKYKERRRETEGRIRETRENLSRVNDILTELRKRLDQLKRQAENAEKYTQLKQQERRLRAELLVLREQALVAEAGEKTTALEAARAQLRERQEALQALEREREQLRTRHNESTHTCQTLQAEFYSAEAELARIEQALAHARELQAVKQRELDTLSIQQQELAQRRESEGSRLQGLHEGLRTLEGAIGSADAAEADIREQVLTAEAAAQDALDRWERFNQESQQPLAQEAAERARVEQLQRQLNGLQARLRQLEQEQAQIVLAPLEAQVQEAGTQLARLAGELTQAQAQTQTQDAQLGTLRDRRAEVEGQLHEVRQALQNGHGRLASLEALQQAALREDDPRLQRWLAEHGQASLKRLAQCIEVESGWDKAVEAVLGEFLQALCVDGLGAQLERVQHWPELPVILLESSQVSAPSGGLCVEHSLAAKVKGPAAVLALLSTVYAVESEQEAGAIRARLQPGQMLVTRAGLCHGPLWVRSAGGGKEAKAEGVLAREQMLKSLRSEVQTLAARKDVLEKDIAGLRDQQVAAEQARQNLGRALDDLRRRHGQLQATQQAQAVKLEQARNRATALAQDLQAQQGAEQQLRAECEQAQQRLRDFTETAQRLGGERQRLQDELRSLREQLAVVRAERERSAAESQRLRVELAGQQSAAQATEQALAELAQREQHIAQQRGVAAEAVSVAGTHFASPEAEQARLRAQRSALAEKLQSARAQQSAVEAEGEALVRRVHEAEQGLEQLRDAVQQTQLAQQALEVRRQGYLDQLVETGFAAETLRAELAEGATASAWEEQLAATERRVQRLGAINLAAVAEYEEELKREQTLAAQYTDLTEALTTLEEAIHKIDRETRSRFQETFEQVNTTFRTIFPKLFGGGEAILELSGDDLLEAGVRVMARPPGKRNSTIHQLSGGEKALTAVSLLFALFELNPAPFCMLDEVDAPLDDANVSRFCSLVQEMSSRVQFVVITHNKVTMEMMDQLNGVTMQEPGVSRLVSVDVEQALAMAG